MEQSPHPIFASHTMLMEALTAQFGANCQTSLYDMRGKLPTLIAFTGNVMERQIGSQLPEKLFERLSKTASKPAPPLLFTAATPDGRRLSSSLTLLSDAVGEVYGCLRVDFCIESLMHSIDVLQTFCNFDQGQEAPIAAKSGNEDVIDTVDVIVSEVMNANASLRTQEKKTYRMNIVRELEKRNVFLVKGAIDLIAARMNISKFTLYNYIDQIRTVTTDDAVPKTLRGSHASQSKDANS